jgi:hypothetical protein
LSWIIVVFSEFRITNYGLTEFRYEILGYPDNTESSKSEVFKQTIMAFTGL